MTRLRNIATGVEVQVADGKHLDGYEEIEPDKAPVKKAEPKKTARTSSK